MAYGRPGNETGVINGMTPQQLAQRWQSLGSDAARAGFIGGPFGAKNLQVLQRMGLITPQQVNALDANYRGTVGFDPATGQTWQAGEDGQSRSFTSGAGATPGRNTYGNNAMSGQGGPVGPLHGLPSAGGGLPGPGSGPTPPGSGSGGGLPPPTAGGGLGGGTIGGLPPPGSGMPPQGGAPGTIGQLPPGGGLPQQPPPTPQFGGPGMPPGGIRPSNLAPPPTPGGAPGGNGTLENSGLNTGGGWGGGGPMNGQMIQQLLSQFIGSRAGNVAKPPPPTAMVSYGAPPMGTASPPTAPGTFPGAPTQVTPAGQVASALASSKGP